jgi:hypothetical protein
MTTAAGKKLWELMMILKWHFARPKSFGNVVGYVNTGIEGVQYLKEYEVAKDKVFRK